MPYRVYIDWNGDGDFSDTGEEVTSRVLDNQSPVTMSYGRDQARALSPIKAGEGGFVLDNASRDYSPENATSPLNGLVVPGREVQITGTVGASTYTMLRAFLDDFRIVPGTDFRYVQVELVDLLGRFSGVNISTGLYQGLRPGEALNIILDAAGWPVARRDIETGATVMPFWWLDGEDAFGAMLDLLYSEGPPAILSVDSAGRIVFRGRHHRLQSTFSTTVQSTWRSSGVEPQISSPTTYNHGWKEIVNAMAFEIPVRQISGVVSQVWTSNGLLILAAGTSMQIVAQGSTPFINAITPVAGVDWVAVAGTVTATLSRNSGLSTVITLTASTGGAATISDLSLRGNAVTTVNTMQVVSEDQSSISKYGRHSMPDGRTPKWASAPDAAAIGQIILTQRAERLPTISVSMVADGSAGNARLTQMMTRNLSDRVHVIEGHTGLASDCFVEQISHSIGQGGLEHRTSFGLEKAPTQILGAFVLGSATLGVLGTGKLGRRASANPATMFTLGSATNGILGTNVLVP